MIAHHKTAFLGSARTWFAALLAFCAGCTLAQPAYFQQETHYRIAARLDDRQHSLQCNMTLQYINHSPDTLREIWWHLWPNAYSTRSTAFAQQALRLRKTDLHFAPDSTLGGISGLDFRADGRPALLHPDTKNPDVARLELPAPLPPGGSVSIETPFFLKIPASFSRLGHVGQSYQLTQWYPKPAVYDRTGWQAMPYLDMGEFYSEFGSFEVEITLPENYVVAATGVLATETEQAFLNEKTKATETLLADWPERRQEAPFPASSERAKTIRFTADGVHDFAWFADKRFMVQHQNLALPSGKTVDAWAFFTPFEAHLWKHGAEYVAEAVRFYSTALGEYPWPQATAVEGALSAGGGMEYPMITIIGAAGNALSLDEVIAHEVGHNWLYGILANNERDHAWLDEGLNSYYEHRYMKQRYGEGSSDVGIWPALKKASGMRTDEAAYLLQARRRMDQAPATTSNEFSGLNYFIGAYNKPAWALQLLEGYIGQEKMDAAMQRYYQIWQFRHPQPKDFRNVLEQTSGLDLHWLFDGLIGSNRTLDYRISKGRKTGGEWRLSIQNKGRIAAPLHIAAMLGDSIVAGQWMEGFEGVKELTFPDGDYDRFSIDPLRLSPDMNRRNNHLRSSGIFRRVEPLRLRLLPWLEDDRHTVLHIAPALAANKYDGNMFGLALYNSTLPQRPFEFAIAPMYAARTGTLAGTGSVQYHLYPAGKLLHGIHFGVGGRMFHFEYNERHDYHLQYARLTPFIKLELHRPAASSLSQTLQWRGIRQWIQSAEFAPDGTFSGLRRRAAWIQEWSYAGEQRRVVNPQSWRMAIERQKDEDQFIPLNYWKVSAEWKGAFTYEKGRHLHWRFFGGGFLSNSRRTRGAIFPEAFNLTAQGFNDYRFDDYYFGRTERAGIWSQQISLREGGMKALTGAGFAAGRSNNFIIAMNLAADLPRQFLLPLKPYFDIGYFDNAMPTGQNDRLVDQILWSGGLALELGDGVFGIYLPLINSKNLNTRLAERGNFLQRIAFIFDLNRLNPWQLPDLLIY